MTQQSVIAIDAMGGDKGAEVIVPAVSGMLVQEPGLSVMLVGAEQQLNALLAEQGSPGRDRIEVVPATQVVTMDEPPADAMRKKKD